MGAGSTGARHGSTPRVVLAAALGLVVSAVLSASACSSEGSASESGGEGSSSTASTTVLAAADVPAVPSPGCQAASDPPAGGSEVHFEHEGQPRWYLQHVPVAHTPGSPVPLVIDLHGYLEGAALHSALSGLGAYGDEHGFVTVTPQGSGEPVHWEANIGTDDVSMVMAMLDEVERNLCIDMARVYATGYSNGAFMTSVLACAHSDRIAAVAPVAGIRDVPDCDPDRPVPVIAFHGTEDSFVQYEGGFGSGAAALPSPDGSGATMADLGDSALAASIMPGPIDQRVEDNLAAWADRNGCDDEAQDQAVSPEVTLITYDCPPDAAVEMYRVEGGGHAWPGSALSVSIGGVVGRTSMDIDATALMWEFFQENPLRP